MKNHNSSQVVYFPTNIRAIKKKNPELIWLNPCGLCLYNSSVQSINKAHVSYLKQQIKKYGVLPPIVVDEFNIVLLGQNTLEAAKQLELTQIPAYKVFQISNRQKRYLVDSFAAFSEKGGLYD